MVKNRSAPSVTVVPMLLYENVEETLEWLKGAFGFRERLRAAHNNKVTHAQMEIGEGTIMLGQPGGGYQDPARHGHICQMVLIHVADVDQHFKRAKQFGARILESPADRPFGERQYTAEDPAGHRWTFSQSIADVAPEEWGAIRP